jgi:hypothetical protein
MSVTQSLRYQGRENRSQVLASDNIAAYTVEGTFSGAVAATLGVNGRTDTAGGDIAIAADGAFAVVIEGVAWKADKTEARAFRRLYLVHRAGTAAPTIATPATQEASSTGALTAWNVTLAAGSDSTNTVRVQFTSDSGDAGTATAVVRVIGR